MNESKYLNFVEKGDIMSVKRENCKFDNKEGSVDMPTLIREIIEQEEAPYKEYREYQRTRIAYLRNLRTKSEAEQEAERERVMKIWQEIGILDENGELTAIYRRGEDE